MYCIYKSYFPVFYCYLALEVPMKKILGHQVEIIRYFTCHRVLVLFGEFAINFSPCCLEDEQERTYVFAAQLIGRM